MVFEIDIYDCNVKEKERGKKEEGRESVCEAI
jgi:hypothetical protein